MYLLDTNVPSELRRSRNPQVARWVARLNPSETYLSAITILEIELGVLSVERRDAAQARVLRGWLEGQLLPAFSGRILPVDTAVARRCAALHVPDPRSAHDALIAATALVHGLKLVTRNVADFRGMDLVLINPWDDASQSAPPI